MGIRSISGLIRPNSPSLRTLPALGIVRSRYRSVALAHLGRMTEKVPGNGLEPMLTTKELADYLGVAPQAIHDLRTAGRGPRGIKVGRELRFRTSEIQAWLDRMAEPSEDGEGVQHG